MGQESATGRRERRSGADSQHRRSVSLSYPTNQAIAWHRGFLLTTSSPYNLSGFEGQPNTSKSFRVAAVGSLAIRRWARFSGKEAGRPIEAFTSISFLLTALVPPDITTLSNSQASRVVSRFFPEYLLMNIDDILTPRPARGSNSLSVVPGRKYRGILLEDGRSSLLAYCRTIESQMYTRATSTSRSTTARR